MTCEQCYVCEQTVLQCSRTMLLAMTYDLCHGGHMVAEYPLLHTPNYLKGKPWIAGTATRRCTEFWAPDAYDIPEGDTPESDSGDSTCTGSSSDGPSPRKADGRRGKRRRSA